MVPVSGKNKNFANVRYRFSMFAMVPVSSELASYSFFFLSFHLSFFPHHVSFPSVSLSLPFPFPIPTSRLFHRVLSPFFSYSPPLPFLFHFCNFYRYPFPFRPLPIFALTFPTSPFLFPFLLPIIFSFTFTLPYLSPYLLLAQIFYICYLVHRIGRILFLSLFFPPPSDLPSLFSSHCLSSFLYLILSLLLRFPSFLLPFAFPLLCFSFTFPFPFLFLSSFSTS